MDELLDRVLRIAGHIRRDDLQAAEVAFLMDTGIPTQQDGYKNLLHAIMIYYHNPELSFTKELYPEVARLSRKKPGRKQVEKNIRYSIKTAWRIRDKRILGIYFPMEEGGKLRRPTNAEYISRIARVLELWQGCCWEEARNAEYTGTEVYIAAGRNSSE